MPKKTTKKKFKRKEIIYFFSCCAATFILFLTLYNIDLLYSEKKVLGTKVEANIQKQNDLIKEQNYWVEFLARNSTYLPGYIELAKIDLELGDKNSAFITIQKAHEINPNSEEVKNLEKNLATN
jgi:hypothetical protein